MCCLSRLEPKFGMAQLALAILPSADMPRLRKRKGRLRLCFLVRCAGDFMNEEKIGPRPGPFLQGRDGANRRLLWVAASSQDQHSVAVAEKAIAFVDGFVIGAQNQFAATCFAG